MDRDRPTRDLTSRLECPWDCKWLIYDKKNNPICRRFNHTYLSWTANEDDNGIWKCDDCLSGWTENKKGSE